MECLADIKSLFPPTTSPFYAAFGNRDSVNTRFRPNFKEVVTQCKHWCLSELSGCVCLQASWRSRVSDLHSESQRGVDPGAGPRKQNNVSIGSAANIQELFLATHQQCRFLSRRYGRLSELVEHVFPLRSSQHNATFSCPEFSNFCFWRQPIAQVCLEEVI